MPQRGIIEAFDSKKQESVPPEQFPDVSNPGLLVFLENYHNLMTFLPLERAAVPVTHL